MQQYQLFANPDGDGYLLNVQSDLLEIVRTRVVIPLIPERQDGPRPATRLHPVFQIDGARFILAPHLIATVPLEILKEPRGNLMEQRDMITAALDFLFQGF
jgi:toxin CcdB